MLNGKLIVAGDINVDGNNLTGVFVECTKSDLRNNINMLFSCVTVCKSEKQIADEPFCPECGAPWDVEHQQC